ncbi:MAG: PorP/SprF family type IX secretion system membrane protein [Chitinophagaceae bacterium]|nr:PorP/SprF family type IX secretion system membrane protein [Chitinophagaceae bacterium]
MRSIKIVSFSLLIVILMMASAARSQDLHFSQWFNSPLTTNPANAGFIPDADYRIGANYRSQYVNVLSVPYRTISIYGDAQLMRDRFENGWLGVGGVMLRDVAGSGNLTSTKIYGSLAYHQMLGVSSLLSAGFNLGWANKSINPANLKFPDQFNKTTGFFDAGVPTSVAFNNTSTSYFDMQVGVNYAYFPTDKIYVNGGFSVHHINRPKESFFLNTEGFDNRLAPRYIGFVNASIKLNEKVIVNPMAYYSNQARASEFTLGGNLNYNLSGDGVTQLLGGVYYRSADAVIPMLGFQWNGFRMTFTYDVTTSGLKNYNNSRGATEFSLLRHGFYNEDNSAMRQSLCPQF